MHDSLFHINTATTSILNTGSQFTQLPNGEWLASGGIIDGARISDEYMLFKQGRNQWTKVGNMKRARWHHASVYIDGVLLTTGGLDSPPSSRIFTLLSSLISHHEHFSFDGGVRKRKELPIALYRHTATMFGNHKMLISGGRDIKVI